MHLIQSSCHHLTHLHLDLIDAPKQIQSKKADSVMQLIRGLKKTSGRSARKKKSIIIQGNIGSNSEDNQTR